MELFILFAVAVGLVWGLIVALRGSLVVGCLAYLLLASCFGVFFLQFDVGPVTLSLDRVFVVFLAGIYVMRRRLGQADPKPWTRADTFLAAFIGLLIASTLICKVLGIGAGEGYRPAVSQINNIVQHLINGYLIPAMVYWIIRQSPLDERSVSLIHGCLACFGLYLAVTGIAEFTGQWWLVFPKYIADPLVGLHYGRARGPMVQSVSYGLYLGIGLLAAWIWRERFGRVGQLLIMLSMPLFLAGIFCSHTRSVWLGVALGLMIVWGLTLRGAWRPLVLGSMLTAGLLVTLTKLEDILSLQRGDNSAAATRDSASSREVFAYVSWQMFKDRPLLGFGFGQFPGAKLPYLNDRTTDLRLQMIRDWVHHNTYLSLLVDTGLVGLGLFLAMLGSWLRSAWRLRRQENVPAWAQAHCVLFLGAMGIYAIQLLGHELTYTTLDHSLIFLLAGVTVGLRAKTLPAGSTAPTMASTYAFGRLQVARP